MSLEGDLLMPPRGPLKWRWLTEMLTKLSKAAGILSPDGSVQINPTTGGVTLYTPPKPSTGLDIRPVTDDVWEVPALTVDIEFIEFFELPKQTVIIQKNQFLCVKVEYHLNPTAMALPAIFRNSVFLSDLVGSPDVSLVSISQTTLTAAQAAAPGGGSSQGIIYIPLAVREGSLAVLWRADNVALSIFHGQFKFSVA
jgi:hypothetical protein